MSMRDELQHLMDRYVAAHAAGDAEGCAAIYGEDACLYSPFGPPAIGRAAIAQAHRDWFEVPEEGKRLDILEAGGAGDLAWAVIAYGARKRQPDGRLGDDRGHNLSIFARQPGGGWLMTRSSLTPDPA